MMTGAAPRAAGVGAGDDGEVAFGGHYSTLELRTLIQKADTWVLQTWVNELGTFLEPQEMSDEEQN